MDQNLIDVHAEDEDVLQTHLLRHLHVRPIHCPDGQASVQLDKKVMT